MSDLGIFALFFIGGVVLCGAYLFGDMQKKPTALAFILGLSVIGISLIELAES